MRYLLFATFMAALVLTAFAQEPIDPAFDPPLAGPGATGGKVRLNGTIGMVIIDGKVYQQFGLRPDIPFGKFGVGLDLTFRFDENGKFKDDEWKSGQDYLEKIYYVRYGLPGDPLYVRVGALDNVTLGYGMVMRRYANTVQYPDIKRVGIYTEGGFGRYNWQAMTNNISELDQPGLMAGRVSFDTKVAGLRVGVTVANDGNQFAGLKDADGDGVPDRLDLFPGRNDFTIQQDILERFRNDPELLNYLIDNGYLPDVRKTMRSYKYMKESITEVGADVGLPLVKGSKFSLWTYAQAAKIVDYGYGWAFPGLRMVAGPVQASAEYRNYEKQFRGQFFGYSYELERAQLVNDTLFVSKEHTLDSLGSAQGYFADLSLSVGSIGYVYGWYEDMHGPNYPRGRTLYGEAGITPPQISRLQKVAGYYMQPNVKNVFDRKTDGTIYGAKVYFALAQNVSLVYDHRISYYNGESHRTVRIETMVTF
jgi:hypothetical protein